MKFSNNNQSVFRKSLLFLLLMAVPAFAWGQKKRAPRKRQRIARPRKPSSTTRRRVTQWRRVTLRPGIPPRVTLRPWATTQPPATRRTWGTLRTRATPLPPVVRPLRLTPQPPATQPPLAMQPRALAERVWALITRRREEPFLSEAEGAQAFVPMGRFVRWIVTACILSMACAAVEPS